VSNRGIKLLLDQNLDQTRIYGGFLDDFNELRAFQANGTPTSTSNPLVRMFGSANAAMTAIGATPVRQGAVGAAANTIDTADFSRYAAARVSQFYLRNFPQFTNVWLSTNAGRSYYDPLQLSLRHQTGALKFAVNYTWSKTIDNASTDASGEVGPLDNFNLGLMRSLWDADRPHTFNWSAGYTLPIGRGRLIGGNVPDWLDRIAAGWEIGSLGFVTSGQPLSISSGVLHGSHQHYRLRSIDNESRLTYEFQRHRRSSGSRAPVWRRSSVLHSRTSRDVLGGQRGFRWHFGQEHVPRPRILQHRSFLGEALPRRWGADIRDVPSRSLQSA
jgi:hypothetical protein